MSRLSCSHTAFCALISSKQLLCKRDLLQSILDTITEKLVTFANGKFPTLIDLINKNDLDHKKYNDLRIRKGNGNYKTFDELKIKFKNNLETAFQKISLFQSI